MKNKNKHLINTYKSYMGISKEKEIKLVQLPYKEYLDIILGRKLDV